VLVRARGPRTTLTWGRTYLWRMRCQA
jgi:hypothetical protein